MNLIPACVRYLALLGTALWLAGCVPGGDSPAAEQQVAQQGVYSARFSNDGRWLMVGSIHHGGSLWSLWPGERHFDWNHAEGARTSIVASAFSADDRYVATADNRTIVLWQRDTGEAYWLWNAPGDILDIELTTTGQFAALAMQDYTATLFDIRNGGIYQRLQHDGSVLDVALDRDDRLLASGSDDLTARIWQVNTGKELLRLKHGNQVRTVELSDDGRWLFTSALRETGKIWDSSSGRQLVELPKPAGFYSAARFSSSGAQLLTGSSDGIVSLWKSTDGSLQRQWRLESAFGWNQPRVLVEDVVFGSNAWFAIGTNGKLYQLK